MYICKLCNYETHDKSNMNKHNKSKYHISQTTTVVTTVDDKNLIKKSEIKSDKLVCIYCNKQYTYNLSLNNHIKICTKKPTTNVEEKKYNKKPNSVKLNNILDSSSDEGSDSDLNSGSDNDSDNDSDNSSDDNSDNSSDNSSDDSFNSGTIGTHKNMCDNSNKKSDKKDLMKMTKEELINKLKNNDNNKSNIKSNSDKLLMGLQHLDRLTEYMIKRDDNGDAMLYKAGKIMENSTNVMKAVSISAVKYANTYYKTAPPLTPLLEYNINGLDYQNNIDDKDQLINLLVYTTKTKTLAKLLGDHLVKCYKKNDPRKQSFHTSDCSRLNYIVKKLIETTSESANVDTTNMELSEWETDKSGVELCNAIINPLIENCVDILKDRHKELIRQMTKNPLDIVNIANQIESIIDTLICIDKAKLELEINKYIAPFFNLKKRLDE